MIFHESTLRKVSDAEGDEYLDVLRGSGNAVATWSINARRGDG